MYFKEQLNITRSNAIRNANFDETTLKLEKTEKLFDSLYFKNNIYFNKIKSISIYIIIYHKIYK